MERPVNLKRKAPMALAPQKRIKAYINHCLKCERGILSAHFCRCKTGILNSGNSCYMNSVLQALAELQVPLQLPHSSYLQVLFAKLSQYSRRPLNLKPSFPDLAKVWKHKNHQEDAHEFFLAMLGICESSRFSFGVSTQGYCRKCNSLSICSEKQDNTFHMVLDKTPLQVQLNGSDEVVNAECTNCGFSEHSFSKTINSPPQILVVKMNRFVFNPKTVRAAKISNKIMLPDVVSVAGRDLKLSCIVMHKGKALTHGHYVTYIHDKEIEIDDDQVLYGQKFNLDYSYFYIAFYVQI